MQAVVSPDQAGMRLDLFVAAQAEITRARAQGLMEKALVWVNDALPAKNGQILRCGDVVTWEIPPAAPVVARAQEIPLDIVYEDGDVIVVNKARSMVVHPAAGHADGTLVNALLAHCGDLSGIGGELRPGIVHRLDKETTGLLVAAKNDAAHLNLSQQLKARTVSRRYGAVALGGFDSDAFCVDKPIGRHKTDRKRMDIVPDGRAARTDFLVLERLRGATLLRCSLHTGRTHQIRVHLRSLGHPILGDELYGPAKMQSPVLMLHAFSLAFLHPVTGKQMRFIAPPPQDYLDELKRLGWSGRPFWTQEPNL